jgi:hypothetical protein
MMSITFHPVRDTPVGALVGCRSLDLEVVRDSSLPRGKVTDGYRLLFRFEGVVTTRSDATASSRPIGSAPHASCRTLRTAEQARASCSLLVREQISSLMNDRILNFKLQRANGGCLGAKNR